MHGRIYDNVKMSVAGVYLQRPENYQGVTIRLLGETVEVTPIH